MYIATNGSEDQELDLSIWIDIHTHTHTHTHTYIYIYIYFQFYLHVFCNVSVVYFMECVSNANLRYNSHMHQLMNFDFLKCD